MNTTRLGALVLLMACAAGPGAASAQPPGERLEVAANLNVLRLSDFSSTRAGLGGRVTFDLSPHLSIEGEVALYPKDRIVQSQSSGVPGFEYQIVGNRRRTDGTSRHSLDCADRCRTACGSTA